MTNEGLVCAVIVAAGESSRFGSDKLLSVADGRTVIEGAVLPFLETECVAKIVIVTDAERRKKFEMLFGRNDRISYALGGETRTLSVISGLNALDRRCEVVLIHDGARPFLKKELILTLIREAWGKGSAIPFVTPVDSVYMNIAGGRPLPVERDNVALVQTPQAFIYREIMSAYMGNSASRTDDGTVFCKSGRIPNLVAGDRNNVKITYAGDGNSVFCGMGADAHRLVDGRDLIIGGVKIPYEKGLLGHSDADVLIHAIMDALLSAAGERDIGVLFPDSDDEYEGISSMTLLLRVRRILDRKNLIPLSVSGVIIAEKPKMFPYITQMKENIAAVLDLSPARVNVGATTTEGLGMIGEGDGIAATANCILAVKR